MDDRAAAKLVREEAPRAGSFGNQLKREREKRGITLDDVSLSTKIGLRMLRALEEERFDQLPGGIFNKGFVRAYARHLGIDEDQAIVDYLEAAGETTPKVTETAVEPPAITTPQDRGDGAARVPWGALAIALLLVALALSVWSYYTREVKTSTPEIPAAPTGQPQTQSSSPTSSTSDSMTATPSTSTAASAPSTIGGFNASGGTRAPSEINPGAEPRKGSRLAGSAASAGNTIKNLSLVSPDSKPVNSSGKQPAAASTAFVVLIEAEENSWVSIAADGKIILEGTLIAPAVKSVRGQKQIVVKAGNVGGLNFSLNGKKLPSQGGSGEVKTLVFGAGGLEPTESKPPG